MICDDKCDDSSRPPLAKWAGEFSETFRNHFGSTTSEGLLRLLICRVLKAKAEGRLGIVFYLMDEPLRLGPFTPKDDGQWDRLWNPNEMKPIIQRATGCTVVYKFRERWGEGKKVLVTGQNTSANLLLAYAMAVVLVKGTPLKDVPLPHDFALEHGVQQQHQQQRQQQQQQQQQQQ